MVLAALQNKISWEKPYSTHTAAKTRKGDCTYVCLLNNSTKTFSCKEIFLLRNMCSTQFFSLGVEQSNSISLLQPWLQARQASNSTQHVKKQHMQRYVHISSTFHSKFEREINTDWCFIIIGFLLSFIQFEFISFTEYYMKHYCLQIRI